MARLEREVQALPSQEADFLLSASHEEHEGRTTG